MALTKVKAGNILLTTPAASSNDVTPATTQYVTTALANLADSAPSTLNTLNELAAALGDDANFSTTVTNSIAAKLPLAGGELSGTLNITQASTADTIKLTRSATSNNNMIKFRSAGADKWIVGQRNDSTEHFRFYSYGASSDVLSIQTDGKVGIGTAGPLAVLEIDPPAVDTPIFAIRRQDHATIPLFKFFQDSSVSQGAGHAHMNSGNRDLSITTDANSTKTNGIYIKTTGEVGIGTTPVAHYTGYKALDIGTAMSLFSNSGSTNVATMTNNGYLNSGASQWAYKVSDEATMYSQVHGDHRFSTAASGSAGGAITWLEKFRITADGKVGIGTTSPTHQLDVQITSTNTATARFLNKGNLTGYQNIVAVDTWQSNSVNHQYLVASSGNGSAISDNEFNLRGDGQAYADGAWNGGGADYAEYFEWSDGNSSSQDRVGYSVSLVNNKIKIAESGETIIGVISGNPAVVGDNSWNSWKDKYQKDDYGRYIRNSDGHRIPNTDYDDTVTYVNREDRKEWDIVGLMGKLRIKKGQQTGTNWIKMRDISATVEEWLVK
jgi:hypothetical protein